MPTVTIEYYGVQGSGKNVTEAKRDAGRRIEEALSGTYTPEILSYRGCAVLVYREPSSGWCYRLIADQERGIIGGSVHGNTGNGTRKETIDHARGYLASITWTREDGMTPPPFLTDRAALSEYRHMAEFNLRYHEAIDRGMSRDDAHSYAGRNPTRPELWQQSA